MGRVQRFQVQGKHQRSGWRLGGDVPRQAATTGGSQCVGFPRISGRWGLLLLAMLPLPATRWAAAAQPRLPSVQIELATAQGFPLGGERDWIELFRNLGYTNVRIRGARGGDEPKIENRGTDEAPRYYVLGMVSSRNELKLPGKNFTPRDRGGIGAWFRELQEQGPRAVMSERVAFGLTPDELLAVSEQLKKPLPEKTRGVPLAAVLARIQAACGVEIRAAEGTGNPLASREACLDELEGISCGTSLAAAVRPLGLVFVPVSGGRAATYVELRDPAKTQEHWPIGWPPEVPPGQLAPSLFKFLPVEIAATPLKEALDVIGQRVNVPMLIDHNNLLRQRVEMDRVKVDFPRKQTFYKRLLDDLLRQALLKCDLRMDDAGKPLLWITTLRQSE